MVDRIAHRGPDAGGVVELVDPDTAVVLGHRRLSIIDLSSAADQPFAKGGLTLTYNGELYNYRELRSELEGLGARFATASDTEVVLEAWRAWGTAALRRFRGMYAFGIHDERTGRASRSPATRSASSRSTSCRRGDGDPLRVGAQGDRDGRRARAGRRPDCHGCLGALLLAAGAVRRHPRCPPAAGRHVDRVPPRRLGEHRPVLGHRRRGGARGARPGSGHP